MKNNETLTKMQEEKVREIMEENDRQRKVDKMVDSTKKSMKIYKEE